MRKLIPIICVAIFFGACGSINRSCAKVTGHSFECVDGVKYVQFSSGAAVMYNRDGSIKTCD